MALPEKNGEGIAEATRTITDSTYDEKHFASGHENYHGIDTRALHLGADEVYERKVALLNEALIDIGMNSFQWKVAAMTGFGWFVDNVSEGQIFSCAYADFDAVLDAGHHHHLFASSHGISRQAYRLLDCRQICRPCGRLDILADDCRFHRPTPCIQRHTPHISCLWPRRRWESKLRSYRYILRIHRSRNGREPASRLGNIP